MKLKEMIKSLLKIQEKYGDIDIYFDCPNCLKSFKPSRAETQAVHISTVEK